MKTKNLWHHAGKAQLLVAAAIGMAACTAHAQIPVTDLASITNNVTAQVETIAQWAQQLQQMKAQIDQYKQQYQAITGARGMGDLLNDTEINSALPADWSSVLSSVKSTAAYATERKKYPTNDSLPKANAFYDVMASQNATMSDLFSKSNARMKQVQKLMGQIDSASDPAAKQDLANRLVSEQNVIQANQQVFAALQQKQKQELDAASAAATKEWRCKEFKSSGC